MLILKSDAIKYFGSQAALASELDISQAAVAQWGEHLPKLRAFELDKKTNGAIRKIVQASASEAA